MSISEKIKTIANKIEKNKAQCNLERHTAKISALSSGDVSKYKFLTGKDVLPEKELLEKAAAMKRFKYSSLGKELKNQTGVAVKQYQTLDNTYKSDEVTIKENYIKSNLIYDANHCFYKYYHDKKRN